MRINGSSLNLYHLPISSWCFCTKSSAHARCRGRRGGRHHRHTVVAPASPLPSPLLYAPHRQVLEQPPSPSPDRPTNRAMVLSDPDTHPRGHQGGSCVVHSWDCPNRVAPIHDPSSSSHQGEEEGEEEDDECHISVVTGPIKVPAIRRTVHISIGPRGQP
jgi:hypothetical protein